MSATEPNLAFIDAPHQSTTYGEWRKEVDTLIGQLAEIASKVPERLGCCRRPTQARGQYAQLAQNVVPPP